MGLPDSKDFALLFSLPVRRAGKRRQDNVDERQHAGSEIVPYTGPPSHKRRRGKTSDRTCFACEAIEKD